MRRLISATIAVSVMLPMAALARQTKIIPGETKTVTATVESIEQATRSLTLKGPEGNYVTMTVPVTATRFDSHQGRRHLDGHVLRESDSPAEAGRGDGRRYRRREGDAAEAGARPGGTAATQRTITATITAIDPSVPVDHLLGTEQLEVHLAGRGHESAEQGQGRRSRRHHVDAGAARLVRRTRRNRLIRRQTESCERMSGARRLVPSGYWSIEDAQLALDRALSDLDTIPSIDPTIVGFARTR